jgi:type II secretory pathway component PulL
MKWNHSEDAFKSWSFWLAMVAMLGLIVVLAVKTCV